MQTLGILVLWKRKIPKILFDKCSIHSNKVCYGDDDKEGLRRAVEASITDILRCPCWISRSSQKRLEEQETGDGWAFQAEGNTSEKDMKAWKY